MQTIDPLQPFKPKPFETEEEFLSSFSKDPKPENRIEAILRGFLSGEKIKEKAKEKLRAHLVQNPTDILTFDKSLREKFQNKDFHPDVTSDLNRIWNIICMTKDWIERKRSSKG
jgi:hypothetical protein